MSKLSPPACVDTVMISLSNRFNPCPILPQPFVCALSSCLGEEGCIIQKNNGSPLCQLAPIRRTYRLCQNRRRPNCSSMPLTWVGELYTRGLNTASLNCVLCNKAGGGEWGVYRLMTTWFLLWRKPVFGLRGDLIQKWKGNKEETHSSS